MRTIHFLWLPVLGLAQTGCTGDVFIATTFDGGNDAASGQDGATTDGGGGGEQDASTDASPPDSARCTTSSECASGQICGFLETPACPSSGTCFTVPTVACLAYSPGCACDGTEINLACTGLQDGYSTKPLFHTGSCTDAALPPDLDATVPCTTDTDCGSGGLCGFPMADACMAQGQCFKSSGAICNSILPGCACDGTLINLACNGLPSGYEQKPYRHSGMCAADGG